MKKIIRYVIGLLIIVGTTVIVTLSFVKDENEEKIVEENLETSYFIGAFKKNGTIVLDKFPLYGNDDISSLGNIILDCDNAKLYPNCGYDEFLKYYDCKDNSNCDYVKYGETVVVGVNNTNYEIWDFRNETNNYIEKYIGNEIKEENIINELSQLPIFIQSDTEPMNQAYKNYIILNALLKENAFTKFNDNDQKNSTNDCCNEYVSLEIFKNKYNEYFYGDVNDYYPYGLFSYDESNNRYLSCSCGGYTSFGTEVRYINHYYQKDNEYYLYVSVGKINSIYEFNIDNIMFDNSEEHNIISNKYTEINANNYKEFQEYQVTYIKENGKYLLKDVIKTN